MGTLGKITIFIGLLSVLFGYITHRLIPADIPDQWKFQILVDILSAAETVVSNLA